MCCISIERIVSTFLVLIWVYVHRSTCCAYLSTVRFLGICVLAGLFPMTINVFDMQQFTLTTFCCCCCYRTRCLFVCLIDFFVVFCCVCRCEFGNELQQKWMLHLSFSLDSRNPFHTLLFYIVWLISVE